MFIRTLSKNNKTFVNVGDVCKKHGFDFNTVINKCGRKIKYFGGEAYAPENGFVKYVMSKTGTKAKRAQPLSRTSNIGLIVAQIKRGPKQMERLKATIESLKEEIEQESNEFVKHSKEAKLKKIMQELEKASKNNALYKSRYDELRGLAS